MSVGVDASVDDVGLLDGWSLGDHHHPEKTLRDVSEQAKNGAIRPRRLRPDRGSWRRREPPADSETDETSDDDVAVTYFHHLLPVAAIRRDPSLGMRSR